MSTTARSVVASSRSSVARLVRERLCGCALLVLDQKLEGLVTARARQRRLAYAARVSGGGLRRQQGQGGKLGLVPSQGSALRDIASARAQHGRSAAARQERNSGTRGAWPGCRRANELGQGQGEVGSMAKPLGLPGSGTCGTDGGTARQQRHGSKIMHGVKLSSLTYRAWKTSTTCPHAC